MGNDSKVGRASPARPMRRRALSLGVALCAKESRQLRGYSTVGADVRVVEIPTLNPLIDRSLFARVRIHGPYLVRGIDARGIESASTTCQGATKIRASTRDWSGGGEPWSLRPG
jgi:hypothetical protein